MIEVEEEYRVLPCSDHCRASTFGIISQEIAELREIKLAPEVNLGPLAGLSELATVF